MYEIGKVENLIVHMNRYVASIRTHLGKKYFGNRGTLTSNQKWLLNVVFCLVPLELSSSEEIHLGLRVESI